MTFDLARLSADEADVLLHDMAEIVSAKRALEDPLAPRAPEWRDPNFEEDPEAAAAFESLMAGREAAAAVSVPPVGNEPPWVPAEERGKADEADAAAARAELLRGMVLTPAGLAALPPPSPLIAGYLTRGSLAATYGRPGTAKSFVAISMALAVVTGTPWFGRAVHRGAVLYVAGEGTSGLAQRQRAWQDACGVDDLDGMFWLPCAVNLLQSDWSKGLAELAAELEVVLVIIDTLARSMVGGDENKSGDMAQAIEAADVIRRLSGATVDLIHHTPKDGETLRGHSALEGAVDTAILIKRSEAVFTLTTEKQKDIPQADPLIFELESRLGSCVPYVNTANFNTANPFGLVGLELSLRDVIGSNAGSDGLPATRLQSLSGIPERSFFRALKNLDNRGVIRNVGTVGRPRWVLADDDSEATLPTLPNAAMAASPILTATGGSLEPRGLAVTALAADEERSLLDLDEEI
jgi:hypothetical protein